MKNIYILTTEKPSILHFDSKLFLSTNPQISRKINSIVEGRNIYITSDEEIKEGDWYLSIDNFVRKADIIWNTVYGKCPNKKIILTTDQDLIKDGVQPIDDEFLEWFVNNPSCEEVEVESERRNWKEINYIIIYKIIIPKEEPKQECEHTKEYGCIKDSCSCNTNPKKAPLKHKIQSIPKEEILANRSNAYEFIDFDKQETLEEVAERLYPINFIIDYDANKEERDIWLNGAIWQKEQQDKFAIEFLDSIKEYERENGSRICFDERDSKELLEIFKNK